MIKKILLTNLVFVLFLFTNSLDGFGNRLNKFDYFYFIDQKLDWGDLYVEGLEIDFKAAVLAQRKLDGGRFDEKIHSIIPKDFSQTNNEWKKTKDYIAYLIGPLSSSFSGESGSWENSSRSVDHLLQDAHQISPIFKNDFQKIASRTNTVANFGPGDRFIVKTKESLVNKVNRDAITYKTSMAEAVIQIGDALRGTMIVDDLEKIPLVIAEMTQYIDFIGGKITFKNLWTEDRESGYVGIHARILFPLGNGENEKEARYILAEMQIHLESMVDGSDMSAKERAHLIYENVRENSENNSLELSAASKLLFLTAMEETLGKLEEKASK